MGRTRQVRLSPLVGPTTPGNAEIVEFQQSEACLVNTQHGGSVRLLGTPEPSSDRGTPNVELRICEDDPNMHRVVEAFADGSILGMLGLASPPLARRHPRRPIQPPEAVLRMGDRLRLWRRRCSSQA